MWLWYWSPRKWSNNGKLLQKFKVTAKHLKPHYIQVPVHVAVLACLKYKCRTIIERQHVISNNVVCATSKGSDQPAHTRSLIRAFASRLNILWVLSNDWTSFGVSKLKRRLHRLAWVYTCQNTTLLEITCHGSYTHTTSTIFSSAGPHRVLHLACRQLFNTCVLTITILL